MVCDLVEKEKLHGDLAELGVYKGNTAFMLADLARRDGRIAYLFDTFELTAISLELMKIKGKINPLSSTLRLTL